MKCVPLNYTHPPFRPARIALPTTSVSCSCTFSAPPPPPPPSPGLNVYISIIRTPGAKSVGIDESLSCNQVCMLYNLLFKISFLSCPLPATCTCYLGNAIYAVAGCDTMKTNGGPIYDMPSTVCTTTMATEASYLGSEYEVGVSSLGSVGVASQDDHAYERATVREQKVVISMGLGLNLYCCQYCCTDD